MKATCEHGRPWFGECLDCDTPLLTTLRADGYVLWRALSPAQRVSYAADLCAAVWRQMQRPRRHCAGLTA